MQVPFPSRIGLGKCIVRFPLERLHLRQELLHSPVASVHVGVTVVDINQND